MLLHFRMLTTIETMMATCQLSIFQRTVKPLPKRILIIIRVDGIGNQTIFSMVNGRRSIMKPTR